MSDLLREALRAVASDPHIMNCLPRTTRKLVVAALAAAAPPPDQNDLLGGQGGRTAQDAGLRYVATADRCERTEADGTVVHYARSLELRPMQAPAVVPLTTEGEP